MNGTRKDVAPETGNGLRKYRADDEDGPRRRSTPGLRGVKADSGVGVALSSEADSVRRGLTDCEAARRSQTQSRCELRGGPPSIDVFAYSCGNAIYTEIDGLGGPQLG